MRMISRWRHEVWSPPKKYLEKEMIIVATILYQKKVENLALAKDSLRMSCAMEHM